MSDVVDKLCDKVEAPCWYSSSEAAAWCSGYEEANQRLRAEVERESTLSHQLESNADEAMRQLKAAEESRDALAEALGKAHSFFGPYSSFNESTQDEMAEECAEVLELMRTTLATHGPRQGESNETRRCWNCGANIEGAVPAGSQACNECPEPGWRLLEPDHDPTKPPERPDLEAAARVAAVLPEQRLLRKTDVRYHLRPLLAYCRQLEAQLAAPVDGEVEGLARKLPLYMCEQPRCQAARDKAADTLCHLARLNALNASECDKLAVTLSHEAEENATLRARVAELDLAKAFIEQTRLVHIERQTLTYTNKWVGEGICSGCGRRWPCSEARRVAEFDAARSATREPEGRDDSDGE